MINVLESLAVLFAKAHVLIAKAAIVAGAVSEGAAAEPYGARIRFLGIELPSGAWHLLNFVILVGFLYWVMRKVARAGQASKRQKINDAIAEATALRDEMRAKFQEYDSRMKNVDERMNQLVADARAEAELERKKAVEEADALAKRVREDARAVADQEIARAKRELQEEQIAQAATLAEGILRANVNAGDQERLGDDFLEKLSEKTNGRQS